MFQSSIRHTSFRTVLKLICWNISSQVFACSWIVGEVVMFLSMSFVLTFLLTDFEENVLEFRKMYLRWKRQIMQRNRLETNDGKSLVENQLRRQINNAFEVQNHSYKLQKTSKNIWSLPTHKYRPPTPPWGKKCRSCWRLEFRRQRLLALLRFCEKRVRVIYYQLIQELDSM